MWLIRAWVFYTRAPVDFSTPPTPIPLQSRDGAYGAQHLPRWERAKSGCSPAAQLWSTSSVPTASQIPGSRGQESELWPSPHSSSPFVEAWRLQGTGTSRELPPGSSSFLRFSLEAEPFSPAPWLITALPTANSLSAPWEMPQLDT